jgi:hypothetical protein
MKTIVYQDEKQSQTLIMLKKTNSDDDVADLAEKMEEINKISD